nr:DsbE family thiol:disulfide interchange protein [Legionella jordanis]
MKLWRLLPFAVFVILACFLWKGLFLEPQKLPSVQLGRALPSFELDSLSDEHRFTPDLLKGQISLLNVWASWCPACTEEQVFLTQLSQRGVPIFGINYKDNSDSAKQWLKDWGNPYRNVGEDRDGKLSIDLGVYGAPETFLVDKKGIIRYRHVGVLDEQSWNANFLPLIKKLEEEL